MDSCIICGTDVDGHICDSHEEDVVFEFRGDSPNQLVPGRYYRGTVDGYADFGVFVDVAPGVTGLLHRSELDRRLESLDWEEGDDVFVQVKDVRDNGNVDLAWSIRQDESRFRGSLIQEGTESHLPDADGEPDATDESEASADATAGTGAATTRGGTEDASSPDAGSNGAATGRASQGRSEESDGGRVDADPTGTEESDSEFQFGEDDGDVAGDDDGVDDVAGEVESADGGGDLDADDVAGGSGADGAGDAPDDEGAAVVAATTGESAGAAATEQVDASDGAADADATDEYGRERGAEYDEPSPTGDRERVAIERLGDLVGEAVRLEGEVVGARQTGGPTVFELRDETGVVDCAAFVEAGVRAYPEIEVGDVVRLDGEVEVRRNEIQVETNALAALAGEEAEAVERRLADALTAEARPDELTQLADHDAVTAVGDQLLDAAEAIRRAVLEGRPIVVRHAATADGYVAGAAIERAVLPLVRDEHSKSDAEYHYFDRRPLEEATYDMDAATKDVTRMLQDRDRHDEKLPLVLLAGTGSTVESEDGLGLLGVYGATRLVVDVGPADQDVADLVETVVHPTLADSDDLSTGALAATLAATVNDAVADDLAHLPAVSYWEDTPEAFVDLAADAGYNEDRVTDLRQAVALEAFYQSYEDKRELITDLLFHEDGAGDTDVVGDEAGDADEAAPESLASHVAAQFREKMETEVETARANVDRHETGGVAFAVLDADAYTHQYDFPPTPLLLDELHRRLRADGVDVTVGIATDDLWLRTERDLDLRAVAEAAGELAPEAGVTAHGLREGRLEFLAGARGEVEDAVVAAITEQYY